MRTVILGMALLLAVPLFSQAPAVFFTDIDSGPNSGGESVGGFAGSYVTVYGNNFGSSQGSSAITWNGLNCLRVVSWGIPYLWYQKISVQLGTSCTAGTGNFVVTVNGVPSNTATVSNFNGGTLTPSAFTVRSGNIRCVKTTGSDSNPGTFAGGCWATIPKAVHTISAGDIAYIGDGVTATGSDPADTCCILDINSAGTAGNPKAIVAYPNATVTLSSSTSDGIRTPAISGPGPYWTFAGMSVTVTRTGGEAFKFLQKHFRAVAMTLSCPNGEGTAACAEYESDGTDGFYLYGNVVNQAGFTASTQAKTYHAFYFSQKANHTDVGWNDIHNVQGCRGIQFYDSNNIDQFDLHIHDNLIHDTRCDAINFVMVSATNGPVEAYNNVMYNVGEGPTPLDGSSHYTCFNINSANGTTNPILLYNNTCYNAGTSNGGDATTTGGVDTFIAVLMRNNIFYQNNGQPYLTTETSCALISGTNNNFFGNGNPPNCAGLSSSRNSNPLFASTGSFDFHLQLGSPMIAAGTAVQFPVLDHDGLLRPGLPSMGAYEYAVGTQPPAAIGTMFAKVN